MAREFDPEHRFVTSWFLPPLVLGCYRALFALFCWTNLFVSFAWAGIHHESIGRSFSYFTTLTWWGITCYMTIAAIHTFVYVSRGYTWLDTWPRVLQMLHSFYYSTVVTYPFLVTIVYWSILYRGPWFTIEYNAYSNVRCISTEDDDVDDSKTDRKQISRHALNSLAALLEIILPATNVPPLIHAVFIVVLLAMYLGLAYVTHVTQGWYPYDFLDPSHGSGRLAGYIVGIAVAGVILFFIACGLIWIRRKITGQNKRSKRDAGRPQYLYQDVEMVTK